MIRSATFQPRIGLPGRAIACLLAILALSACPKKASEPSDDVVLEVSPSPQPTDSVATFGSSGRFGEPDSGANALMALSGRLSCPPVRIEDSLACAIGGKIFLLKGDGTSRSVELTARVESLLCSYDSKDGSYLAIALADGRLLCLDYGTLAIKAERQTDAEGAFALSGTRILRAAGKRIERISLPALLVEESAERSADISLLAANGRDCLAFLGGNALSNAVLLPSDSLAAVSGNGAAGNEAAAEQTSTEAGGEPTATWIAPFAEGFLVLLSDGRAAFMENGRDTRFLSGFFDAEGEGFAVGSQAALKRRDGGLCVLSANEDGEIEAIDAPVKAESAVALEGGWLWYASGRIGYARSSGTPIWEAPLAVIPVFPPFAWDGRIAICARDGLYLLPGAGDPAIEGLLDAILIPKDAAEAIAVSLGQQRPMEGRASVEPYRPGARKAFGNAWRIAVFEPRAGVEHTMRIKGKSGYFILAYDQDGNKLASNFAYELEEKLELTFSAGRKYAIAFAPKDPSADAVPVELSVTEK